MRKTRIFTSLILAVILITSLFALNACTDVPESETMTVLNVSLNPEVEFVLDSENKVVSVNALNEDGNVIISATAFANVVGLSAPDAVKLFIDVSSDTGFLLEGNLKAGENQIGISISGDKAAAEALYNDVKTEVQNFLSKENLTATFEELKTVGKQQLEQLLAECAPYLEQAEIEAMEQAEIIKKLLKSRKETAELHSQELKKAFYEMQEFAFDQAEIELLKTKLDSVSQLAVQAVNKAYTDAIAQLTAARINFLVKADSIYQQALSAYRTAKADYLNFRNYVATLDDQAVTNAINQQLDTLEGLLETAETALISAGETANATIDTIKDTLKQAHDAVISLIETFSVKASDFVLEITVATNLAVNEIGTAFNEGYSEIIAAVNSGIDEMLTILENGYNTEG